MNRNTRRVAVGGMMTALATAILMLGGVIPAATFCGPALAGLLLVPVLIEGGIRYALGAWLAVSALGLMLCADKEAALLYAKFINSYEMQKFALMNGSSLFYTAKAIYSDPECIEKLPVLAFAEEALDEALPRPQVRDYPTISTIFAQYFHEALTGTKTNEQAMADMDAALNAALAEMQG